MATVYLDLMRLDDLNEVSEIERDAFNVPWPSSAYRRELRNNRNAYYIVVRCGDHEQARTSIPSPVSRRLFPLSFLSPSPAPQETGHRDRVLGHAGLWRMLDQAHITTIAVHKEYRRRGFGELLLTGIFDLSRELQSDAVTLEVRKSNYGAQRLYVKFGFREVGIRPRYYSDNNEDAVIMWTDPLRSSHMEAILAQRRQELAHKLGLERLPDWLSRARSVTQKA
ncbi:MAG: ribosomal protein S18-alanine N-acetyltransferase [Chloroflexi bacterium]|nr:ribosomal protein S18-alanine N-acetyltransferase [Chloroflexota bacterium]MCL5947126.1 ribosomal protein S18-alanine N-acetyltransferase [Chloroflexota bacterium]